MCLNIYTIVSGIMFAMISMFSNVESNLLKPINQSRIRIRVLAKCVRV